MRTRTAERADARIEELVAAPGIAGEDAGEAASLADDGVGKAAGRSRKRGRAAAAVALRPDAGAVDLGQRRQHAPGSEHVVGAGGKQNWVCWATVDVTPRAPKLSSTKAA